MPRFIKNGPIVPDKLVQELEEDRVVIFCGAGISAGAGLPDFRGLVEYCYAELGATLPSAKSSDWNWLDRMLGTLESNFPNQMRAKVVERLNIDATDLATHRAILKLAQLQGTPRGGTRLVTTNFDLFFEQAQTGMSLGVDFHSGPVLPIPRNDQTSSWRSIVYLHGRLDPTTDENHHLVLTSADFGRAYLTDAWAARFVVRLFSEFTILFIGYSLNDPVLRYMTDAFAAEDSMARSNRRERSAYIFVPYRGSVPIAMDFMKRGLQPIFYRAAYRHRALKNTLVEWANARDDYLASVQTLIRRSARRLPSALQPSDAANVIWAVCDRPDDGGHGANVLATLRPLAPIEWLNEFERRDAEKKTAYTADVKLAIKEGRKPLADPIYHIEALFPLQQNNTGEPRLGPTSYAIIDSLLNFLSEQKLVDWAIEKIGNRRRAHPALRVQIRRKLDTGPAVPLGYELFWRIVASEGGWANNWTTRRSSSDLTVNVSAKCYQEWYGQELTAAMRPLPSGATKFCSINGILCSSIPTINDCGFSG